MKRIFTLLLSLLCLCSMTSCALLNAFSSSGGAEAEDDRVNSSFGDIDDYLDGDGNHHVIIGDGSGHISVIVPGSGEDDAYGDAYGNGSGEHTHSWQAADCYNPKTCTTCGATEGEPRGHAGGTATCSRPALCFYCGEGYGDILECEFDAGTCQRPRTCIHCGFQLAVYGDHKGGKATCSKQAICSTCGEEYGSFADHDWKDATCTAPATCKACGETSGYELGHDWSGGTCTRCGQSSGQGSSGGNVTVTHLTSSNFPTFVSGGTVTGATYRVDGNDLYITVTGTSSTGTTKFSCTVYGGGYKVIAEVNASASGSSFAKTVCVSGVITSEYRTYKVFIGYPSY